MDSQFEALLAPRILVIASELLELIEASELTLGQVGGTEGLARVGEFESPDRMIALLRLLDGYYMPESTYDGLFENLAMRGFEERQVQATIELGLIEMHSKEVCDYEQPIPGAATVEWFQLSDLGREVLESNDTRS